MLAALFDHLGQRPFPGVGGGEALRLEHQARSLGARRVDAEEAAPVLVYAVEPVGEPADTRAKVADVEAREPLQHVVPMNDMKTSIIS